MWPQYGHGGIYAHMIIEINYDLRQPGQNYDEVQKRIGEVKDGGGRVMYSCWLITSKYSVKQIRDHILPALDTNDSLLVNVASAPAAWTGLSEAWSKWINDNVSAAV